MKKEIDIEKIILTQDDDRDDKIYIKLSEADSRALLGLKNTSYILMEMSVPQGSGPLAIAAYFGRDANFEVVWNGYQRKEKKADDNENSR